MGKVTEPAGEGPVSDKKVQDMPLDTAAPDITTTPIDWLARADRLAETIAVQAAAHDADDSFVANAYALLKAEGFFKALVPVAFGGGGAETAEICRVIRRLGAACGSTALAFAMHSHLVAVAAWRWRKQGAPTEGLLKRVAAEDLVLVPAAGRTGWPAAERRSRSRVGSRSPRARRSPAVAWPATCCRPARSGMIRTAAPPFCTSPCR